MADFLYFGDHAIKKSSILHFSVNGRSINVVFHGREGFGMVLEFEDKVQAKTCYERATRQDRAKE